MISPSQLQIYLSQSIPHPYHPLHSFLPSRNHILMPYIFISSMMLFLASFHQEHYDFQPPSTIYLFPSLWIPEVIIILCNHGSQNFFTFLFRPCLHFLLWLVMVNHCPALDSAQKCTFQSSTFTLPFYILPIHGADVVLGVQWLQMLGPFIYDYSVPHIQFHQGPKHITIIGQTSPPATLASYS